VGLRNFCLKFVLATKIMSAYGGPCLGWAARQRRALKFITKS